MRKGEKVYKDLDIANGELDEDSLINTVVDNPILLERPVVVHDGRAAIGRPPEAVLSLFSS